MDANTIVNVINRSSWMVSYEIPETDHRHRNFAPGEVKKIPYGEIEAVCQQNGGQVIFDEYLMIQDPKAAEEAMNKKPEPEYFMTAEQVKKWLPTCSLDELLDALDFAPEGVLSLIKQYAVELPLSDMNKCNAIKEKLHFDVIKALELIKEDEPKKEEEKKERRAAPKAEKETGRRVSIKLPENKE